MAVIHEHPMANGTENSEESLSDQVLQRLEMLEIMAYDTKLALSETKAEHLMQRIRTDSLFDKLEKLTHKNDILAPKHVGLAIREQLTKADKSSDVAWKTRLVFKTPQIIADGVWRGSVSTCLPHVTASVDKTGVIQSTYFGSTCDPNRRFKEHQKSLDTLSPASPQKLGLSMNILYHTTQLTKAADMECRLLKRYNFTRNVATGANGLLFGKPSYFVYMLKTFVV